MRNQNEDQRSSQGRGPEETEQETGLCPEWIRGLILWFYITIFALKC